MAKIKGKNSLSARELFKNRMAYSALAFSPDQDPFSASENTVIPLGTADFWWKERGFYGKLSANDISEPHEPFKPYLKVLKTARSSIKVMNFVADAFNALQQQFLFDIESGNITTDDPMIPEITPVKGYVSVSSSYSQLLKDFYKSYLRYLDSNNITDKILNLDDFINELVHYIMNIRSGPFTRSGFIMSRHISPLMSGLCIEIKDLPYSEDEAKIEFINSPNFDHYLRLANDFGFAVDKNIPWRLVANIKSEKMVGYIRAYEPEVKSALDISQKFYLQSAIDELEVLKEHLISMYNQFVVDRPVSLEYSHSSTSSRVAINSRSKITMKDLNSCYSDCYWLELYIKLRNRETGLNYPPPAEKAIVRVAKDIQKTLDTSEAMSYIKRKFSGVEFYEGSLSYEAERNRQVSSGDTDQTPSEVIKAVGRKIRKIFF